MKNFISVLDKTILILAKDLAKESKVNWDNLSVEERNNFYIKVSHIVKQ